MLMSWEKDYEIEIVCPKCGVIAKYAVFSDDWMRSEDRWILFQSQHGAILT